MIKAVSISLFTLFILNLSAQSKPLTIGSIDTIYSKVLGEKREIWVYVPDQLNGSLFATGDYPVAYVLDGPSHFLDVVGMTQQLSSVNGNAVCPKMIVVGISNTNRTRDLTPTKGNPKHPFSDSAMVSISGGGALFLDFLQKELFPHIESNYPTKPHRIIIGHSFGGLLALYAYIHRPELFNSYVAIDPSVWWADHQLLTDAKTKAFEDGYAEESLYLGIANTMPKGLDTATVRSDSSKATEHIRLILELNEVLLSKNLAHFSSGYYPREGHGTVPLVATYDALYALFDFYNLEIGLNEVLDTSIVVFDMVKNHYIEASKRLGYSVLPPEALVNATGYGFMNLGRLQEAEKFFLLNTQNYPKSFNVFDSLGDYYLKTEQKEKAITAFQKSIELNKESYSKGKLEELLRE